MATKTLSGGARVDWHPERLLRRLNKSLEQRFEQEAQRLEARVKDNISVPTATSGPSAEGGFPHMDKGELVAGISHQVFWTGDVLTFVVSSSAPHTPYLEFGGRSFLRRTLAEEWKTTKRNLTKRL